MTNARERTTKRMLKIGFMRRWYARRMVSYIDKSKKKKRRLPDELVRVDAMTKRLPKQQRVKVIEEMMTPGQEDKFGRQLRRAAERQNRESGRGGARRRPGMPPTQQVVRKPAKRAR